MENKEELFHIPDWGDKAPDIFDMIGAKFPGREEFDVLFNPHNDKKRKLSEPKEEDKTAKTNNTPIDPNEDALLKGTRPFVLLNFGKPGSGKSELARYVAYEKWRTKAIDYIMVASSTPWTEDWGFIPKKAVKQWSEKLRSQIINFQNPETNKKRGHLLLVLEDPAGSFPWEDPENVKLIIGHRHLNISVIANLQYVYKITPVYRECATNVAMFKQFTKRSKEALYDTYGGEFGRKEDFYKVLKDTTKEKYHFLYFQQALEPEEGRWSEACITPIPKDAKIKF